MTAKNILELDFGKLSHYKLQNETVFLVIDNSSSMIQELIKITQILTNYNIKHTVDENFNIHLDILQN